MELIIIYLIKKVREKTAEIDYISRNYILLMILLWMVGEWLGFVIGSRFVHSGFLLYLIAASCGLLAALVIYYKALRLEPNKSKYFDLGQSENEPHFDNDPTSEMKSSDMVEILKERNKQKLDATSPVTNPQANNVISEERKPAFQPAINPEIKPEIKPDFRPEIKPETNIGFKKQTEMGREPWKVANSSTLQFPYNELLSINELATGDFGMQTIPDRSVSEYRWFATFKAKYENHEVNAAVTVLERALAEDRNNGLVWLLFGILYKDAFHDFDRSMQFYLTGAKRCNAYKTALLTEAAELLLFQKKDILNAFKFFCLAIIAISDRSKAWGDLNANGGVVQERAFHFIRVLLTAFNFNDYRLYLERNVHFSTGMDQSLIENVLGLCAESPIRAEIEQRIPQMFPLIIEKLQALA